MSHGCTVGIGEESLRQRVFVPSFYLKSMTRHSPKIIPFQQKTLGASLSFFGKGVHLAQEVELILHPAPSDTGFVFIRKDLPSNRALFPASYSCVKNSFLATRLCNAYGDEILTPEHLLCALVGLGIHNAYIELSSEEVPILDGSAKPFVDAILKSKESLVVYKNAYQQGLYIKDAIDFQEGSSRIRLTPSTRRLITYHFDGYGRMDSLLSQRSFKFDLDEHDFSRIIAPSRTFGFYEDGHSLQEKGFALGANLDNTIIIKEGVVMNQEGLRFQDEFIRHKVLDLMGDFALSNMVLYAHIEAYNTGHDFNNRFLRHLFESRSCWDYIS